MLTYEVIEAIKMRPTHSNLMYRISVGGYCLKRSFIGFMVKKEIFKSKDPLFQSIEGVRINDNIYIIHIKL